MCLKSPYIPRSRHLNRHNHSPTHTNFPSPPPLLYPIWLASTRSLGLGVVESSVAAVANNVRHPTPPHLHTHNPINAHAHRVVRTHEMLPDSWTLLAPLSGEKSPANASLFPNALRWWLSGWKAEEAPPLRSCHSTTDPIFSLKHSKQHHLSF